ncbi:hypothetical protein [Haloferula sp. A504]|uniref:hypothetical protein n=1 Tax=Haloferula sp. A504 TaxID=3373601 RepID=UPI0031BE4D71|nr:hypothetical protein [Verrucomicrobiaceae bacterium E54]
MRYFAPLLIGLAFCFAVQALALRAVGGRTAKSESNFFSSIGRIQAGAYGEAKVMVLGSSITGRLPDRAQGFDGWANMGCDGGSAIDVLRAMDNGVLPVAPQLVIEANTLHLPLERADTEIGRAMKGNWFKVGMKVPQLSASARPAAFFYSKLLERRIGVSARPEGDDLDVSTRPTAVGGGIQPELAAAQRELFNEVKSILRRLKIGEGTEVVFVWLPPARSPGSPPPSWILELARESEAPFWDLGQDAGEDGVVLTDGVHMDAASAARTMRSLRIGLADLE